jgi:hypothetical protein
MVYIIGLIFQAQVNLMREILCVITLILYVLLVLTQNVYTIPWKHPYTPTSRTKLIQQSP